jgi:hypothetical protein
MTPTLFTCSSLNKYDFDHLISPQPDDDAAVRAASLIAVAEDLAGEARRRSSRCAVSVLAWAGTRCPRVRQATELGKRPADL